MREGNKTFTLNPSSSHPYSHTIDSSPSTPKSLLKVRGWFLRFKNSEIVSVPYYYTIGDITLEIIALTQSRCLTSQYLTMELNIVPYIIIWYVTLPTFYHQTPPYQYSSGPHVCLCVRLFFPHSEYDRLSVHTLTPNYEIRNPSTWHNVIILENS